MSLHLDGARIFNAAAALDVSALELAGPADSVTFCLSKGLCSPVGSVLCASADFIHKARRIRKQLGGGMRQAGILAAAGIVALNEMTAGLKQDHLQAQKLARGLAAIPGILLKNEAPPSNMVFFSLEDACSLSDSELIERLKAGGVLIGKVAARQFRLVTHYWINDEAVERTLAVFNQALTG